ncbi:MAG: site-specific integrase [Bacteroidaceae bacterium]|nr:site-specific integrase [Bacteroidaceae bacterium]
MATTFIWGAGGMAVRCRVTQTVNGKRIELVNRLKVCPELVVLEADWKRFNELKTEFAQNTFLKNNQAFAIKYAKMAEIKKRVDDLGTSLTKDSFESIIHNVLYSEQIEAEEKRREKAAARKAAREEARRKAEAMTLTKFIDQYIESIESGEKTTVQHGRKYARGSRFNTANSLRHFKEFMEDTRQSYDFADVDLECYSKYKAWLMSRDISKGFTRGRLTGKEPDDLEKSERKQKSKTPLYYSDGTIGRFIKQLKAMLRAAEVRGYPVNPAYRSTEFKAQVLDIDAIYLTMKEIEAIEKLDLSTYHPDSGHENQIELARDIFMIGVWTAQRVSDYNNIGPQNIKTFDNNGKEQLLVSIHQQKTGRFVEIPCNSRLRAILEKYPEGIPHISEQWLNKYIKILGKLAGLDEMIEINESRGGEIVKSCYPKYQLICTHTARRTGATLMYLAGIPIYDIMKVTGHRSVATLEKYIRADKLEVAQKLARTYDYFE